MICFFSRGLLFRCYIYACGINSTWKGRHLKGCEYACATKCRRKLFLGFYVSNSLRENCLLTADGDTVLRYALFTSMTWKHSISHYLIKLFVGCQWRVHGNVLHPNYSNTPHPTSTKLAQMIMSTSRIVPNVISSGREGSHCSRVLFCNHLHFCWFRRNMRSGWSGRQDTHELYRDNEVKFEDLTFGYRW